MITQQFINDFLFAKLGELNFKIDLSPGKYCTVEIKNLEVLMNNELLFDLEFSKQSEDIFELTTSAFIYLTGELTMSDESKDFVDIYGSPNEYILEINKSKNRYYNPSADPTYIEWCINNLDIFCLDPNELIILQNSLCWHFYGVNLYRAPWGRIYKYEPYQITKTFAFKESTILNNESKFRS